MCGESCYSLWYIWMHLKIEVCFLIRCYLEGRLRLKCDGTRAETRFRLSAKRMSLFKLAGTSLQSNTGSRGVRISVSNAGYTMFRGSVKSTEPSFLRLVQGRLRCEWTGLSELDLHLSPFPYMAIDWRLVTSVWWKAGDKSYPRFSCEFRGHGPTLYFWFWDTRGLGFGRPAGAEDSSCETPWSYADARVCIRAKTDLVLGDFKILFGVLFSVNTRRLASWYLFRYIVGVDVGIGWKGPEAGSVLI
jgi:hypothetical protein